MLERGRWESKLEGPLITASVAFGVVKSLGEDGYAMLQSLLRASALNYENNKVWICQEADQTTQPLWQPVKALKGRLAAVLHRIGGGDLSPEWPGRCWAKCCGRGRSGAVVGALGRMEMRARSENEHRGWVDDRLQMGRVDVRLEMVGDCGCRVVTRTDTGNMPVRFGHLACAQENGGSRNKGGERTSLLRGSQGGCRRMQGQRRNRNSQEGINRFGECWSIEWVDRRAGSGGPGGIKRFE